MFSLHMPIAPRTYYHESTNNFKTYIYFQLEEGKEEQIFERNTVFFF